MEYGVSAFAWTGQMHSPREDIFAFVREAGFAAFEIAMFDPRALNVRELRRAYREHGLDCTICAILPRGINPISPQTGERARAREHLRVCVETAGELGAKVMGGPVYAPIGYLPGHRPTQDEFEWAVEALRSLGDLLEAAEIKLGIEPVNRAETFFLRTAAEAATLAAAVGHARVGVTVDTFHANIEEKTLVAAVEDLGPRLFHVHASENDRGLPGTGHVDFAGVVRALESSGYDGYLMIEGFGYAPEDSTAPGHLWAAQSVSPEDIALQGLRYLKGLAVK